MSLLDFIASKNLSIEEQELVIDLESEVEEFNKCEIPIRKLKGLIDESSKGNIRLEVIAEDTYFTPWESKFKVEQSKKVTVEVKSQSKPKLQESKNTVHILSQPTLTEKEHILNLLKMLIKEDININNLTIKKNKLNNIVAEYIQENPITEKQRMPVIEKVIKVLEKRK